MHLQQEVFIALNYPGYLSLLYIQLWIPSFGSFDLTPHLNLFRFVRLGLSHSAQSVVDLPGKGVANPIAQILSGAMMLRLDVDKKRVERHGVVTMLWTRTRTPMVGGWGFPVFRHTTTLPVVFILFFPCDLSFGCKPQLMCWNCMELLSFVTGTLSNWRKRLQPSKMPARQS